MKKPVKICKNPECRDDILDYKSAKRNYCNDSCRNRAGYLNRLKVNNNFIHEYQIVCERCFVLVYLSKNRRTFIQKQFNAKIQSELVNLIWKQW